MNTRARKRRLLAIALGLALLASLTLMGASGLAVVDQDVLANGNFESGFTYVPGCGMVGNGWVCFTNGGSAEYGFYDDQWDLVRADGLNSQLIEINTLHVAASENDRFAGIYQTARVVAGAPYQLSLSGLMRERGPDSREDPYRYRVQWGYTSYPSTDWTQVVNWVELPWDKIDERTAPTGLETFGTSFVAPSDVITLYFRVWKKWGTYNKEFDVNLDAISLWGPAVKPPLIPADPFVILPGPIIKDSGPWSPPGTPPGPATSSDLVCSGPSLVRNGSFESGFTNGVGDWWTGFTNGGRAAYGFYDEMWPRVVKDGTHGQLIEINTKEYAAADADRFAGIYQVVSGLRPGATYEFSLWGLMREEASHPDEDMYRYRVEFGYVPADGDPSEADITNWVELPWDTIYLRTDPGEMLPYSVQFQAPSRGVVVGVRAWKKWGTTYRELDVNLDAIRLSACRVGPGSWGSPWGPGGPGNPGGPGPGGPGGPNLSCAHTVAAGESLLAIAHQYGTTVPFLARVNEIADPDVIYIGQVFRVPCSATLSTGAEDGAAVVSDLPVTSAHTNLSGPSAPADGCAAWHVVEPGDALYELASRYDSSITQIAERNRLADPDLIYVGQRLCIPQR